MTATISIPADHDASTIDAAYVEINAYLDYEEQTDRLDDRTREGLVIALEVLSDLRNAYRSREGNDAA